MPNDVSIKAIETEYKGIRFRSRLEARWAVFFDSVNERYEYEPDSFFDGIFHYIPDFYLPDREIYVEVKGPREDAFTDVCTSLGVIGQQDMKLLVLTDLPNGVNCYFGYPLIYKHPFLKHEVVEFAYFQKNTDGKLLLRLPYRKWVEMDYFIDHEDEFFSPKCLEHGGKCRDNDLHECFTKAKGFRFEKGGADS